MKERPELRKPETNPLTDVQLVRFTELINAGKLAGRIRKFRGNYYFIPDKDGSESKNNS